MLWSALAQANVWLDAPIAATKTWAREPLASARLEPASSMNSFSPARRC
jgi:hypothetical protein